MRSLLCSRHHGSTLPDLSGLRNSVLAPSSPFLERLAPQGRVAVQEKDRDREAAPTAFLRERCLVAPAGEVALEAHLGGPVFGVSHGAGRGSVAQEFVPRFVGLAGAEDPEPTVWTFGAGDEHHGAVGGHPVARPHGALAYDLGLRSPRRE